MRLVLRLQNGWSTPVQYLREQHAQVKAGVCPDCGAKLWVAPHGGVYCDAVHVACPNCGKEQCECD